MRLSNILAGIPIYSLFIAAAPFCWAETVVTGNGNPAERPPLIYVIDRMAQTNAAFEKNGMTHSEITAQAARMKGLNPVELTPSADVISAAPTDRNYNPVRITDNGYGVTSEDADLLQTFVRQLPPEQTRPFKNIQVSLSRTGAVIGSYNGDTLILQVPPDTDRAKMRLSLKAALKAAFAKYFYDQVLSETERDFIRKITDSKGLEFYATLFGFDPAYDSYLSDSLTYMDRSVISANQELSSVKANPVNLQMALTIAAHFVNGFGALRTYNAQKQIVDFALECTRDDTTLKGYTLLNIGKYHFIVEKTKTAGKTIDRIIGITTQDIYKIGANNAVFYAQNPSVEILEDSLNLFPQRRTGF